MSADRRIGFDARMWSHPGIGRYIRELLRAISAQPNPHNFTILAAKSDIDAIQKSFPRWTVVSAKSKIYSRAERSELESFSQAVDLLHVPHFNVPASVRARLVTTVHDLIYLQKPNDIAHLAKAIIARAYYQSLCRLSARIIAVSEFTKKELCRAFPASRSKTIVIHEAASDRFFPPADPEAKRRIERRYALARPYFLFVGTLKPHKNLYTLIESFKEAKLRFGNMNHAELLLVGKKDEKEKKLLRFIRSAASAGVRHLENVPDEDLPALYHQAVSFVMPSLLEGFGLPLLEAMACGALCLSSDQSSLREVGGEAVLYFDPRSQSELAERLVQAWTQKELSERLRQDAQRQAAQFSWTKTAARTLDVYQEVLG